MSIFKEMLAADINSVFFNTMELADEYEVGGKNMPVVQDDNRILERSDLSALGTELGEGLIFVRAADMPHIPMPGDRLPIRRPGQKKAEDWYVRDAIDNTGVYEIRIGRKQRSW